MMGYTQEDIEKMINAIYTAIDYAKDVEDDVIVGIDVQLRRFRGFVRRGRLGLRAGGFALGVEGIELRIGRGVGVQYIHVVADLAAGVLVGHDVVDLFDRLSYQARLAFLFVKRLKPLKRRDRLFIEAHVEGHVGEASQDLEIIGLQIAHPGEGLV